MKATKLDLPVMSSWIEDNALRLDSAPYLSGAMEAKVLLDNLGVEADAGIASPRCWRYNTV
jgi:hypothetical protein